MFPEVIDNAALRGALDGEQDMVVELLLSCVGEQSAPSDVIKELDLVDLRKHVLWKGSKIRGGRGLMVTFRTQRVIVARAKRQAKRQAKSLEM